MIVYRELSSLARNLGVKAKTLYAISNQPEQHYHRVKLPKRDGGCREFSVPNALLKRIQRRITEVLLVHMPISPHATAYRYGGGTLRNARLHVGRPILLKLDIHKFFDNILYSTVKEKAFPTDIWLHCRRKKKKRPMCEPPHLGQIANLTNSIYSVKPFVKALFRDTDVATNR